MMPLSKRAFAEFIGTFWLVFGGCGSAVLAAAFPALGIGIAVTNLSVNPARGTGPAVFVGGWAVEQLWLFWVAPIIGAAPAGVVYAVFATEPEPSMRKSLSARA
jgi:glycerol uptake facilitator-like aquaporin